MIGRISAARRAKDEGGSILVLTTLLMPALVAIGAVAVGATTLWTSHLDAQRAVDLAALAGAANTPTASIDSSSVGLPFDIPGLTVTFNTEADADAEVEGDIVSVDADVHLDNSTEIGAAGFDLPDPIWQKRPCQVFRSQLNVGRSAVLNASRTTKPTCTARWEYESKLLAALAACVRDQFDVPDCERRLEKELARTLPALDPLATEAAAVVASFVNPTSELLTPELQQALKDACLIKVPLVGCTLNLLQKLQGQTDEQLAAAGLSPTGDLLPYINPRRLAPGVMTPRVTVRFAGGDVRPMLSPYTFDLDASATARRTIKRAIVLPTLGIEDPTGGLLLNPDDVVKTSAVPNAAEQLLDLVDSVDSLINDEVIGAAVAAMCDATTGEYTSSYCPEIDGPVPTLVATEALRDVFMQDLRDVTEPPPNGSAPTLLEQLDELAASGDPVWAVAPLKCLDLSEVLQYAGLTVNDINVMELLNPTLAPLFENCVMVPSLDVVPVTVSKVTCPPEDLLCTTGYALTVINDAGATPGLFQARLVK